jgi:hypothetical protein
MRPGITAFGERTPGEMPEMRDDIAAKRDLPPTWHCRNVAMVSKHAGRKMREGKYHAG